LKRIASLEYLLIGQTKITDDGVRHLKEMRNLKGLSLIRSQLSPQAVDSLRQALPNCQVVVEVPQEQSRRLPQRPAELPELAAASSKESVGQLRRELEANPGNKLLQYQLAVALARSGQLEAAFPHFVASVGSAAAHYNLGVITYENAVEASRRQFSRALDQQPNLAAAEEWLQILTDERAKHATPVSSIRDDAQVGLPLLPAAQPEPVAVPEPLPDLEAQRSEAGAAEFLPNEQPTANDPVRVVPTVSEPPAHDPRKLVWRPCPPSEFGITDTRQTAKQTVRSGVPTGGHEPRWVPVSTVPVLNPGAAEPRPLEDAAWKRVE
jgi:hypothetical protein